MNVKLGAKIKKAMKKIQLKFDKKDEKKACKHLRHVSWIFAIHLFLYISKPRINIQFISTFHDFFLYISSYGKQFVYVNL